jgi:plasmid stabilization system protein ParE
MGAKRIEYHQGASADVKSADVKSADVKSAVAWYVERSPKAALDFLEELNRASDVIHRAPERWPEGKSGTRHFVLWRFPFTVIYSERESVITIWAVAHASRRPEYWAGRL